MRSGFILLHRQGLTADEWKHPLRTLAWIDFLTMAAWEDFTAPDGVKVGRGEVIASYGFLATRWRVSKDTAFSWMRHWIAERQVERRSERCTERSAERFFLLNYAKYQDVAERVAERPSERSTERTAEQMKRKEEKKTEKLNDVDEITKSLHTYLTGLCQQAGLQCNVNIRLLDELVQRHRGLQLRVEVRKCVAWMSDQGKKEITTSRLTNWFSKATEIARREDGRRLDWLQAHKDPMIAQKAKTAGVKTVTPEPFAIDPSLKARISQKPDA